MIWPIVWEVTYRKEFGFFYVFPQILVLKFVHNNFEDYYWESICPAQICHRKSVFIFLKAVLSVWLKHLYFDFKLIITTTTACCSKALHTWWHLLLPSAKCRSVPSQWGDNSAVWYSWPFVTMCTSRFNSLGVHGASERSGEFAAGSLPCVYSLSIPLCQSGEERGQSQPCLECKGWSLLKRSLHLLSAVPLLSN